MIENCFHLLKRVELEINTHCNKHQFCGYCPNSKIAPIVPPRFMEENLYTKIIDELRTMHFSGRISYHFYGEPLLHPDIDKIIRLSSEYLPEAEKVLYTNGDLLDDQKYDQLVNAGIDMIAVSNHEKKAFPIRSQQIILENFHLNSKGGLINTKSSHSLGLPLKKPCFALHHRLIIAYNGDVLICYEDAERKTVIGNVKEKTIQEVWTSEAAERIRCNLTEGRRNLHIPCQRCDNEAHTRLNQVNVNHFNSKPLYKGKSSYGNKEIHAIMNRVDEKINNDLSPRKLHSKLESHLSQPDKKEQVNIWQISSNTLKIGRRLDAAFAEIGKKLNINPKLDPLKTGDASLAFFSKSNPPRDAYTIIHIHGMENEERLLEYIDKVDFGPNLIVYIHRPEELILRLAFENKVDYKKAKYIVAKYLQKAKAVVLPGPCFIDEYRKMIPEKVVVSIPLGAVMPSETLAENTVREADDIFFVGSCTTWGEMRHIDDVVNLLKAIKRQSKSIKIVGYILGSFDRNCNIEQYVAHNEFAFLGNEEIIAAFQAGAFHDESGFRKWLFGISQGKVVIRAKLTDRKATPESFSDQASDIYKWENKIFDFNVQMYHEILDMQRVPSRRKLPKVEYSGTLHAVSNHSVFVVLDSLSMQDIQRDEGLRMIMVGNKNGCIDFDRAAKKIIDLAVNNSVRMAMVKSNTQNMKKIGMREVAFAYFTLISWLKKISINDKLE